MKCSKACCHLVQVFDQNGRAIPDLGYADDFVLLATNAMGLQRLLGAVAKFCTSMGMVISIQKTKVIAFGPNDSVIGALCRISGLSMGNSWRLCFKSSTLVSFSWRI